MNHSDFKSALISVVRARGPSRFTCTYVSMLVAPSQVDLGKASTSQDRLERQLDILQVHQKQISDALNLMEAEAEHLSR